MEDIDSIEELYNHQIVKNLVDIRKNMDFTGNPITPEDFRLTIKVIDGLFKGGLLFLETPYPKFSFKNLKFIERDYEYYGEDVEIVKSRVQVVGVNDKDDVVEDELVDFIVSKLLKSLSEYKFMYSLHIKSSDTMYQIKYRVA